MPAPDLPAELWLEILSYLPSSSFVKLIGVNKTFFELAFDDEYKEVRLLSRDLPTLRTFEQLRHENIARRVHHLCLRPDFLKGPGDADTRRENSLISQCLSWSKKLRSSREYRKSLPSQGDSTREILQVATESFIQCRQLRRITLMVDDHPVSSAFSRFLSTLWSTLGWNLQEICIQASHRNIPLLLAPLANMRSNLPNLSSLELTITHSQSVATPKEAARTTSAIAYFLKLFKTSLTSFSFTPLVVKDISPLFDGLDLLPNLKKLALLFPACGLTSLNPSPLAKFLSRQSATLEHLVMDQKPPHSAFFPCASVLGSFLASEHTQVKLTEVHTLQIASDMLPPRLVPDILPKLRNLIINPRSPSAVSFSALPHLLDSAGGVLESLDIRLWKFSTETLDLLASRCPRLRRLTVGYSQCTSIQGTNRLEPYSSRRYPHWPLDYVRLGRLEECGGMHPDAGMMEAVAQTVLPRVVEKDIERRCLHLTY
ncbi:hypothetical protein BKA70DRAFT_1457395 [Coprinopsis sp. MPI-PUGE-AT-0042]|nr:hypothetical protein BKA70DRAFT_1457395 [Coprinopsis sp. MPI-PUGE-AT-0042]